MPISHSFVSAIPDGADATLVRPSDWNADHVGESAGVVPLGGIIMWSGTIAAIPADWALCDGTLNAPGPDLRDRFIVGATADDAGVAKTNLTGSLTQSGGSISHHHADHSVGPLALSAHSGGAVSTHSLSTNVAISAHAGTAVSAHAGTAVSAHSRSTDVALSAHAGTAVSAHAGAAVSAHSLTTNVAIAAHGTGAVRTSNASSIAAATVVSHTITQPVVGDHSITQPSNHSITQPDAHAITQPTFSDHSITQPSNHTVTQPDAHTITQPVVAAHAVTQPDAHAITQPTVDTHDTLAAPQPYFALAFIQRMA